MWTAITSFLDVAEHSSLSSPGILISNHYMFPIRMACSTWNFKLDRKMRSLQVKMSTADICCYFLANNQNPHFILESSAPECMCLVRRRPRCFFSKQTPGGLSIRPRLDWSDAPTWDLRNDTKTLRYSLRLWSVTLIEQQWQQLLLLQGCRGQCQCQHPNRSLFGLTIIILVNVFWNRFSSFPIHSVSYLIAFQ